MTPGRRSGRAGGHYGLGAHSGLEPRRRRRHRRRLLDALLAEELAPNDERELEAAE
jgi:uncharacterized protein (DUF58 family)